MRIVIAGSSGYLGNALRRAMEGNDIVRLVRRTPGDGDEIQWDPYRGRLDASILDGVDAVVNLCGAPIAGRRWNAAYKRRLRASRVIPTQVLAEAVAEAGVPLLVNASASGWYGDRADVPVDETTPAAGDYLGKTCVAWESATSPAQEAGARVVRLRTGHVLGPGSPLLAELVPTYRCLLGGRFGNGRQYLPWISLRDWTGAVRFLLDADVTGPVNMVGPTPATNREFTRALAAVLHRPAPWIIPGWAARLVAGEAAIELLRGAKIQPTVLRGKSFAYRDETVLDALRYALAT
ncbi:TIGR01777 family oxidoreductase [Glycomyces sp. L485]|uniref:TIGR01777 family oxidoreductase n=1 Tax=Glycomyces sp. L485 TaxID=2909235 RepID=UPI001F4A9312|nr:TIGR01777 family oxidoreductase [Glycomyces sp. L485]MCH7232477.1 TIGR01777 family oxidoreductase [Glycomyces sp. L485]